MKIENHAVRFEQPVAKRQKAPTAPAFEAAHATDSVRFGASAPKKLSLRGDDTMKAALADIAKADAGKAQGLGQQWNDIKAQFGANALVALQVAAIEKDMSDGGVPGFLLSSPMNTAKDEFAKLGFDRQMIEQAHQDFNSIGGRHTYGDLLDTWKAATKHLLVHFITGDPTTNSIETLKGEDILDDTLNRMAQIDSQSAGAYKSLWADAQTQAGSDTSLMIYMGGLKRRMEKLPLNYFVRKMAWSSAKREMAYLGFGKRVEQALNVYDQTGGDPKYASLADLYFNLSEQQLATIIKTPA